jgi:hypothetical protein
LEEEKEDTKVKSAGIKYVVEAKFFVDGNITYSLPDFPNLGAVRDQFKTEFTMPKL